MKTRLAFSRLLVVFLAVGIMAGVAVSVPTVTLVSPPDGSIVNSTSVSFTCSAADLEGLTSAALYVGGSTTTVTFSGPTETDDAQISANSPNSNYGSLETINVDGYNPHAHAVIKFPNLFGVGQVPSGSSIVSATLEVNCFNYGNLMEVYRLTEDWVESEVTWNERAAGVAWTNAGADGPGSNAGVATTGDCSVTGWRTIDITQFVQEWSNGADNYGIVITDNGGTDGVDFYTSESGNRPVLTVTYRDLEEKQTQAMSGTEDTVTFAPITLLDQQDYAWNCLVTSASGQSWAPADFHLTVDTQRPDEPVLVAPADGATGVSIPATLEVTVSDPQGDSLDVTFYGKGGTSGDDDFAIVALPDTQYYSQSYPDIFTAQTQWIVDNASSRNIVFVTHEGDIVQNYNVEGEWINANYSMSLLDGVVAYGLLPGNHDMDTSTRRAPLYNSTFPSTRYEAEPWYGGHYDSDADWDNNNNYQLFSAGGMDFIVLHLEYNPRSEVIGWADGVLSGNAGRMAIITTHAYLNTDGNRLSEGTGIWNVLVQGNDNVYFVLCGHMHGEAKRTDVVNGREVHQILADYQSGPNGGNGYLRIMRFVPAEDKVYVETYSPYLDQYQTDSDSQFSLDVPMEWYAEIGTNTDVSSGSNTSVDWSDLQPGTAYEWFVEVSDTSGNTRVGPTWQFTTGGNQPPIANAGSDQTVSDSDSDGIETVILDGSGSYDPDGTITGYEWKEGTTVLGIDAIITCDFSVGAHTVTLTVTDDEGASDSDDVIITVNANAAPVADAGDDQTINDSDGDGMETVTLDGAGSADSDGTIVSYEWDTDGDGSVDKVGVTVDAVFSVGTHTVTLTVTDNGGATATDDVVVTVSQPDYDAYVSQDPTVTYGLVGGGIEGTTSAGDGLVQTITEVPNGTAGMASLQAEYVLSTTANPADVTQLTLYLDATWTSLDADAPLAVAIWNGSGWEDITEDISDGSFAPGIPQDYVDDGGNIYVRFTDTAAIKKEKKDTLTIDLLYAQVLAGPVNNPPSVTISQPANGSTFDSGALISFGGTATDVEDGDLTASLVWQSSINGQIGTGGSVSVTLSDGEHLITASATDSGGKTGSASISITVGDPPPAAPTGLVATAGNSLVRLDWDDNAESDLAGYNVYRSQTEGGPYSQVNGTLVTASDYEDAGMTNGTTYYYVVTAVDQASNESPVSSEVSATPSEQPAVYVESIGMSLVQAGKNWKGVAQVAINPALSGATVVGDWYLNEELIQTGAADVTDGSGQTSFTSAPKKANTGATFTFRVTDVVVSGYVYDSGQGVTQGSITVQ